MLPVYSGTILVDISHKGQNNHPRKVRTNREGVIILFLLIPHQDNACHNCTILTHIINLEFTHIYIYDNTVVN